MTIGWGILGTGFIARAMADALQLIPEADLTAIGSRTQATADSFGDEYGVPHLFDNYQAVCECADVDLVYVATPHIFHARDAKMALEHGKAVLCEKPFTMNAIEAAEVIDLARSKGLFLMEAMWTRFVPAIVKLREWIAEGIVGDIRTIHATLGWETPYDAESRLLNPALGGGALLDLGVYPISFCSMLLGTPVEVSAVMVPAPTGVDMQCAGALSWGAGALATFVASLGSNLPGEALIVGTQGSIRIHAPLFAPQALTRRISDAEPETFGFPYLGNGYAHEAIEVMDCLAQGKTESGVVPLNETLAIMRTLDGLQADWS